MDWNSDGKKDLITGENNGKVRIYLNTNTDQNPIFKGYAYLKLNGADFDCGHFSMPHVADWNNDNKKDLICGEKEGRILLLINQGTNATPVFNTKVFLKSGSSNLDVGEVAAPTIGDFNRDNKKDLLVGESNGYLAFFINIGSDADPKFNGPNILAVNSAIYDCGAYSRPDVADWNNDGVLDIFTGANQVNVQNLQALGDLSINRTHVSESHGGVVDFSIDASLANGGTSYVILGSVSGTKPGTLLGNGVILPINWDLFTNITVNLINTPVFSQFQGTLDPLGSAQAQLNTGQKIGSGQGWVMSFAFVLYYPFAAPSNPVHVEILP